VKSHVTPLSRKFLRRSERAVYPFELTKPPVNVIVLPPTRFVAVVAAYNSNL
jgi:hypothetical protein